MVKRKHIPRYLLDVVVSHIRDAIRAQNDTVVSIFVPAFFYRGTRNSVPLLLPEFLATSGTPVTPAVHFALPVLGITDSSSIEPHRSLPSSTEWRKLTSKWWYYIDGKWSGIIVSHVTYIQIHRARQPIKALKLPVPYYQITHRVINKAYDIDASLPVASFPTRSIAQRFAELYIREWQAINS